MITSSGNDWVRTRGRFPGRCRKGSGGCGRPIQAHDRVWMRLPSPGKRLWSVLICFDCGVANGLNINYEDPVDTAPPNYDHLLPFGDR